MPVHPSTTGWTRIGLDLVTLSDHPYRPERLDTVALLSAIVNQGARHAEPRGPAAAP
jgi:hypothetical protein